MNSLAFATPGASRHPGLGSKVHALPAPRSLEELGLPFPFLVQLVSKIMLRRGAQKFAELAAHSKIAPGVLSTVIEYLRREQRCEVLHVGLRGNMRIVLTDSGRAAAEEYLRMNPYIGPAPVSLEAYSACVERQARHAGTVTREAMAKLFPPGTLPPTLLDKLGAAINSGRAVYLHGAPGSGKTYIAERLGSLLEDTVLVPHALLVEGQAVRIYDSAVHEAVPGSEAQISDPRWVLCKRPVIRVGAELTLAMLDLRSEGDRARTAPLQLKANNGLLVIDDLGRQDCSVQDLVHRLTVPLERRADHLTFAAGEKARYPLDVRMIFCADQPAAALGNQSFVRRLAHHIEISPLPEGHFRAVWRHACAAFGVASTPAIEDGVLARLRKESRPLLACTPGALLGQIRDHAHYLGVAMQVDDAAIERAWSGWTSV